MKTVTVMALVSTLLFACAGGDDGGAALADGAGNEMKEAPAETAETTLKRCAQEDVVGDTCLNQISTVLAKSSLSLRLDDGSEVKASDQINEWLARDGVVTVRLTIATVEDPSHDGTDFRLWLSYNGDGDSSETDEALFFDFSVEKDEVLSVLVGVEYAG